MKKTIRIVCLMLVVFILTGCTGNFGRDVNSATHIVGSVFKPEIERNEDDNIVYNGNVYSTKYRASDSFIADYYSYSADFRERFGVEKNKIIAHGEYYLFGNPFYIIGEKDFGDAVITAAHGDILDYPSYRIKDGFELPDIESCEISSIFIDDRYGFNWKDDVQVCEFESNDSKFLFDIIDKESMLTYQDIKSLSTEKQGYVIFDLKEYETFYIGFLAVLKIDDSYYVTYKEDYYRIVDEYQIDFKNAISRLQIQ